MHKTEEKETAVKQREWLLQDIIPLMLEKLKIRLQESKSILKSSTKSDSLPLVQNEAMKGFITVTGSFITKADLSIKMANYHQESPIKASITDSVPYFLEQAQQATNYLSLAISRIHDYKAPSFKQTTIELLEDMYQFIDRALHAFDYPNEASLFPYKVCHPKFFSPPLKQELVIEFCIQDVFIVCNVYALDYHFLKHGTKAGSDHPHV
ncbi:RAVE subunit 2/Rogdi [Gilbertella persicaria]|uniref:RAVE subunit 2/Rogdi n=1 Tax=Gilbertella persicaria TaxID=101096 RepID=UPI002220948B|nr:RAVE subunit 2/Rogdi [Gilbertella persicaria]KAI8087653.1 RAVE subunit 2/Rogdi [Gilbertella persicaria]